MARSLLIDAAGVVFLVRSIGTPPCPRKKRMLRSIFLIARPPLLAVMRGGGIRLVEKWRLTWIAVRDGSAIYPRPEVDSIFFVIERTASHTQ